MKLCFKIILLVLALSLALCGFLFSVTAQEFTEGEFRFSVEDSSATVIEYLGSDEIVHVPNFYRDNPVNSIASGVFMSGDVKVVYLPDTIMEIGEGVFGKDVSVVFSSGGTTYESSHSWDDGIVIKSPSCIEEGEKQYTCRICGEKTTGYTPTTDHTWNKGEMTVQPTCTEDGFITYTCTVCSERELELVSAPDAHVYDNSCDTQCNLCSFTREAVHSPGSRIYAEQEGHYRYCTVCGIKLPDEVHTYIKNENGNEVCSVCNYVNNPKSQHIHNIVKVDSSEPNCTEPGNIEYYRCIECNDVFSDAEGKNLIELNSVYIVAKGHTVAERNAKAPSATEVGTTSELYCTVCGTVLSPGQVIPQVQSDTAESTESASDSDMDSDTVNGGNTDVDNNCTVWYVVSALVLVGAIATILIVATRKKNKSNKK